MIETTQRSGIIRVVDMAQGIFVGFNKRELSPALSSAEARALARMLTSAARRGERNQERINEQMNRISAKVHVAHVSQDYRRAVGMPTAETAAERVEREQRQSEIGS